MTRALAFVLLVCGAALGVSPRANAQADLAALVASAETHAGREEWAAAASDYATLRAQLGPDHAGALDVLYNESFCRMNAGQLDEAARGFTTYAANAASDGDREAARALVAQIEASSARVAIDTHGTPADVVVADLVVGHAPGTVRVRADEDVTLELRAEGHAPAHRTLHVAPGGSSTLDVTLVQLDAAASEALERIARGRALLDQQQYDGALAELDVAADMLSGGGDLHLVLRDTAQCHQRLGQFDLAARDFRRYLELAPADAPDRAAVQASLDALLGLLGTLTVRAEVPARVLVDGREAGRTGTAIQLATGTHEVEVRARGRESDRRTVQIAAGRDATVDAVLAPVAHGLSPEPFVGLVAATGAALVATVAVGTYVLVFHDGIARFGDDSATRGERDELGRLTLATDVLLATTGALGLASLVIGVLTDFDGSADEPTLRPVVMPLAQGVVLGASGTF